MKKNNCVQGDLFPELGRAEAQPKTKKSAKKQVDVNALMEELKKLKEANLAKIAELTKENEALKKKAEAFDDLMQSHSLFPTGVIAKNYGKSAIWLNQYLHQKGVQFEDPAGVWKLYAKYQDKGYSRYCFYNYGEDTKGRPLSRPHMYWTAKGLNFIRELLIKDGLLKD